MAIVRTLTTLFDFTTKDAGLKDYQSKVRDATKAVKAEAARAEKAAKDAMTGVRQQLSSIKSSLGYIGGLLGAELAIQTVGSFVTGLANNIRAANRMGAQLSNALAPGDDVQAVMDHLFNVAQDMGDEFTSVGQRFKEMVSSARTFGVSTQTTMAAFENISKSIEVSRLGDEEVASTWERINSLIARGGLSARAFGELMRNAPRVVNVLAENLGVSIDQLRKLATDGKITSEVLIKGFARANKQLSEDFINKPNTLGEAFNYAYNEMVRAGQALWKITYGSRVLADSIVWLTRTIVSWGKSFIDYLGGVENALNLVKYAIIGAFGYYSIGLIATFITYMRNLSAAAALAQLKFLAIAAAVGIIILAIDDFIAWMQGRPSIIGDLIGPSSEWQKQIDNIKKPFEALLDMFKGDWTGGFKKLGESFTSIEGAIAALLLVIPTVKIAFMAWNTVSWATGLIKGMLGLITQTGEVKVAAGAVETAIGGWNKVNLTPLLTLLGPAGPVLLAIVGIGAAIALVITHWDELKQAGIDAVTQVEAAANRVKTVVTDFWEGRTTNPPRGADEPFSFSGSQPDFEPGGAWAGVKDIPVPAIPFSYSGRAPDAPPIAPFSFSGPTAAPVPPIPKVSVEELAKDLPISTVIVKPPEDTRSFWQRNAPSWLGGAEAPPPIPAIAPGGIAPAAPTTNTQTNNVPITNNVNVNVTAELSDLEGKIRSSVDAATNRMAEDTARQLTRSMPRMEAATGQ